MADFTCWYCGAVNPTDVDHDINCATTADMDSYILEERAGLHGPDVEPPVTDEERAMLREIGQTED